VSAAAIAAALAVRIETLVRELLPGGRRDGHHEWRAGNVLGEHGDSLGVHLTGAKRGVWSDFATGETGDALDLVKATLGLDTCEALIWSRRWLGLEGGEARRPPAPARKQSSELTADPEFWRRPLRASRPIAGTQGEVYFQARGLRFADPNGDVLRFLPRHARKNPEGVLEYHPALLAVLSDIWTGEPCGIVCVYLQPDGSDRIRDAKGKTSRGRVRGAAVMISPFDSVTMGLIVCEGAETAISLHMAELRPVWATAGAGNLMAFPVLPGIEAITIAADNGAPGQQAAAACAERWRAAGREALIIAPPSRGDWADAREPA
jgi:phage/plasmid primase-like uncharacterized protein